MYVRRSHISIEQPRTKQQNATFNTECHIADEETSFLQL